MVFFGKDPILMLLADKDVLFAPLRNKSGYIMESVLMMYFAMAILRHIFIGLAF